MKLFAGLMGRTKKQAETPAPVAPLETARAQQVAENPLVLEPSDQIAAGDAQAEAPQAAPVNIWDLDDNKEAEAAATNNVAQARARRNRTRLIGFDTSEGEVVDLFDSAEKVGAVERVQFPVGWLLVTSGPGRGHAFSLFSGMAQIGRSDENAVQLDFGDSAISRNNHAAIVYDTDERQFVLGHGGKANIVRLNGKPVISNEEVKDGDEVVIGETTLQLKTLCGPDFDWADTETSEDEEEHNDVAIA